MPLLIDLNAKEIKRYKPPLVFISDIIGSEGIFTELARLYDEHDPKRFIYALRSPFRDKEIEKPNSLEKLVEMYVNELSERNHSEFFLCGYSFGGVIGLELAKQLSTLGKKVSFFCSIDTDLGNHINILDKVQSASTLLSLVKKLAIQLKIVSCNLLPTQDELQKLEKKDQIIKLFDSLNYLCNQSIETKKLKESKIEVLTTVKNNLLLSLNYTLSYLPSHITVTLCVANKERHSSNNLGWGENTDKHQFDTNHFDIMLDPKQLLKVAKILYARIVKYDLIAFMPKYRNFFQQLIKETQININASYHAGLENKDNANEKFEELKDHVEKINKVLVGIFNLNHQVGINNHHSSIKDEHEEKLTPQ